MSKKGPKKTRKEQPRLWVGCNPVADLVHELEGRFLKILQLLERWIKDEITEKRSIFETLVEFEQIKTTIHELKKLGDTVLPGPDEPGDEIATLT